MISDTGVGMSAEVHAHLFEPFLRRKNRTWEPASASLLYTVSSIKAVDTSS
jgi:hypothetical protein